LKSYATEKYFQNFIKTNPFKLPTLEEIGFVETGGVFPKKEIQKELIKKYDEVRDIPSILGTSRLSVHLRFGTVSIRKLAKQAIFLNEKWLNELIWRDFYMNILYHFPHICDGHAFRKEYDNIIWRNNETEFKKWCEACSSGVPNVEKKRFQRSKKNNFTPTKTALDPGGSSGKLPVSI
jgi:deoxyribodipyrimidine photo-lyase